MGGVAGQQINLAGAQCSESLWRRQRSVLNLVGIAEEGGSHGATDVDIKPGVGALRRKETEAGNLPAHTTEKLVPLFHQIQPGTTGLIQGGTPAQQPSHNSDGSDQKTTTGSDHQHWYGSGGIVPDSWPQHGNALNVHGHLGPLMHPLVVGWDDHNRAA